MVATGTISTTGRRELAARDGHEGVPIVGVVGAGGFPSNRETASERTGAARGTSVMQGTTGVTAASGRNSDRLNPKEDGMMPMCCSMDALEELPNESPSLHRLRGGSPLPRVILASQSPRRRRLLNEHGVDHTTLIAGVDDGALVRGGVTPAEWVAALAYFKAAAAREKLPAGRHGPGEVIILGADTVVRKGDRIVGQPADAADAESIVRLLQNGEHEVLTGVAFIDAGTGRRDMWVDRSRVRVGDIGDERIQDYIAGGNWRGKAGAYNLVERLDAGWPIEFEGDAGTIMGLPMRRLVDRLMLFRDSCIGAAPN